MPTPFPDRLKELVREHGTSISRLYDDAEWAGDGPKPSKAQLDKSMRGLLPVRRETMEMLAAALGEPPDVFVEYELAVARDALDERVVGLDEAYDTLIRVRSALRRKAGAPAARRSGAPHTSSPRPTRAGQRAPESAQGD